MSYVHKIIGNDEKLVGIARLHWIYIVQGVLWFLALAGTGYIMNALMVRGMYAMSRAADGFGVAAAPLSTLGNGLMIFMLASGFLIFLMYVIKVLSTSIALTDRRVIHKHGLIFVKAHQIDVEEIRGENLDLGYLGRIFGYGYIMLDCKFVGDIRLPAMNNPERFLRALHEQRATIQNALNLVVGKSGVGAPINVVGETEGQPKPEVPPPAPEPEVSPTPPDQIPVPPNQPMPQETPPMDREKDGIQVKNIAASRVEKLKQELIDDMSSKQFQVDEIKAPPSLEQVRAQEGHGVEQGSPQQPAAAPVELKTAPVQAVPQEQPMTKEAIAKVVEQVTPQIAQQVVKEMTEQGLINQNPAPVAPENKGVDNDLINVFDEAALDKDGNNDVQHKMEYAIH